jgi:hypothetical protein
MKQLSDADVEKIRSSIRSQVANLAHKYSVSEDRIIAIWRETRKPGAMTVAPGRKK